MPLRLHNFDLRVDASSVEVSELSHALALRLVGRWRSRGDFAAAQTLGLLDDYLAADVWADHAVELLYTASGVLADVAHPAGRFGIEDGKYPTTSDYFYVNGLAYGLRFNGQVVFDGGEVRFAGRLKTAHGVEPDFEIQGALGYDPAALALEEYQWSTLAELANGPVARVRRIGFERFDGGALPDSLARFEHLRHLTVANFHGAASTQALTVPPWIGGFAELEGLFFQNVPLLALPAEVGGLRNLWRFAAFATQLTALPQGLFTLPRLQMLTLSQNRLTALPERIALPELESLYLANNRLARLPDALLPGCPKLTRVDLQGNRFKVLPKGLNAIEKVSIEVEVRQRLSPKPSPGGSFDAGRYAVAPADAHLLRLREAMTELDAPPRAITFWTESAVPAVAFEHPRRSDDPRYPQPTSYAQLGRHRFGGLPDLPAGTPYPTYVGEATDDPHEERTYAYEFIAQLDCAALAPLQAYLPRTGFLYFFLSTIHDLYGATLDRLPARVEYHDVPRAHLASGQTSFPELTAHSYYERMYGGAEEMLPTGFGVSCYTGFDASAKPVLGLAPPYPAYNNVGLLRRALGAAGMLDADDEVSEEAGEILDELIEFDTVPEDLFGRMDHTVGDYGFSQHELPQTAAALALGGEPTDYLLLLEVKSRGDMQWGDAGELHYVIHKGDLERLRFDRVWVGMYSS